jgi:AraC family transcriptional regulator
MPDLTPISRAIAFIEAHLRDELTVAAIAEAAGYSLYHFIRAFNQATWHTPYDYLMRRRLSTAAIELLDRPARVIEIAFEYRFNNHETFSRAFKRLFGMQPVQWREHGNPSLRRLLPAFSDEYLAYLNGPHFRRPVRAACPAKSLSGLPSPLPASPETLLLLGKHLGLPPGEPDQYYGLTVHLDKTNQPAYTLAACELPHHQEASPPLLNITLPAGDYLHIPHPYPHTWAFLYHTWLPKAGLNLSTPIEVTAYTRTTTTGLWLQV